MIDDRNLKHAQQLEKDFKWSEAADQYVQLLNEVSFSTYICERAGWCLSRAGKYNDSIIYFKKLYELEPHSAKWPYLIGYQYYSQEEWDKAIYWFKKALLIYPDYFVVKYRLAYAYIKSIGNYKKLTKAEYWIAMQHLKDCHCLWDTFDESKKQKERSTYYDINFLHGKILMDLPNYRNEAIRRFQIALDIKPTNEFAKYNLAKTYFLNGDYEKAKKNLPISNKYYVVELSAFIDSKLGDNENAITTILKLLDKNKKDYLFRFLAEIYLLTNNIDKAYIMAQQSVLYGQNNHKNYHILAKVYYHYGLLNKAIGYLNKAIALKKTNYGSAYEECDILRENILSKMHIDYYDDENLLEKLQKLSITKSKQGTICRYNSEKGFGFIKSAPKDIFFHVSNCKYKGVSVGDFVQFKTIITDKGIMAVDVIKLK
ncbi:MAG TPA: tetratricopeptide repeat protein [Defluviitaleaceae bacterium]|nr:tetratricopeptide repeat protein [Defluviitaleaceae bacterium]